MTVRVTLYFVIFTTAIEKYDTKTFGMALLKANDRCVAAVRSHSSMI